MGSEEEWKRFSEGSLRLFDVLLLEDSSVRIFDALARIAGETLDVDRSLIYDVSFTKDAAECLTEWIPPERTDIARTKAIYPLAVFRTTAETVMAERHWLKSDVDAPFRSLVADGAAPLLHGGMSIKSLLWFPFLFRDDGFFILAFNHCDDTHAWKPVEIEFMRTVTRHVTMALVKVALIEQRSRTEQAMFAAQKLESLGVLAGGLAHDINNLMVGVVSNAELVESKLQPGSPLRERVVAIREAGERAASLAGQMLAYAGKGGSELSVSDPCEALEVTVKLLRASLPDVRVEVASDQDVPSILCNRAQLDQVLMNLLLNAAEAMQGRQGAIRTGCDIVDVDERDAKAAGLPGPTKMVRFQVADEGPGIAPATLDRIFDPFFTTKFAGRGLGLSAVQGIVRSHGGAVGVESTEGKGTRFSVLWPVAPEAMHKTSTRATPPSPIPALKGRVLVIDDEPAVLNAISAILEDDGFAHAIANGGAAALEKWRAEKDTFDAVLLDLTMPPPRGLDVLAVLRADVPTLPVVIMSGYTDDPGVAKLADKRTIFIRKPFSIEGLLEALAKVLRAK